MIVADRAREELVRGLRSTAGVIRTHLKPFPRLTVSEWADANRVLPKTSAEPGQWRTDRTPFLRAFMDLASRPEITRIVFMKPAQCGGSEALLNILGFFIDQDPAPILMVLISTGEAEKFSKERVAPLISESPAVQAKVAAARSRDSGNTIDSKDFDGGHLGIVGANAPAGLRSRPRRVLLMDEVDGYPASAGTEGNPRELARKRLTTFWNSLEVEISTPTIKDLSAIETDYNGCDERWHYHVPCPHCGELQVLKWGGRKTSFGLKWEVDEFGDVTKAQYLCEHCHVLIDERHKTKMLRDEKAGGTARWVPDTTDPVTGKPVPKHPHPTKIGVHLNGLYSPWLTWKEMAQEWLDAQGNPLDLQVFVNTRLAETWEEKGSSFKPELLINRREEYPPAPLLHDVVLLTMGVDVQSDRLEAEILGWGVGEETWSIEFLFLPGDPTTEKVWKDLDLVLARTWDHPTGGRLRISGTCVDAGYATQQVKKYAGPRLNQNVWAVKGVDGFGRPIFEQPKRRPGKVPVYPVGVDTAKSLLYGRLAIDKPDEPGPISGYCHFPKRAPYDEEYFSQLTSEKVVLRQAPGGQLVRQWIRKPGRLGEKLDCRVYAIAAYESLFAAGLRLDVLRAIMDTPAEEPKAAPEPEENWATSPLGEREGDWV